MMYSYSEIIDLQGENLQGESFRDHLDSLEKAKFQGANLKEANFRGVNLQGAEFQGADLKGANLHSANLRGARFQGADLKDANLQSADLHETNFKGAKLHGANLKECKDIQIVKWTKAEYDDKTQFPDDFDPCGRGLIKTYRRGQSVTEKSRDQLTVETDAKLITALVAINKSIQKRQGQNKFREDLIGVYLGRCAITGCRVKEVLEAAHVKPYCSISKQKENCSGNGILLRADIHTLFDLNLIIVHPKTKRLEVKESLQNSRYRKFDGVILQSYQENIYSPDDFYLNWRIQNYGKSLEEVLGNHSQ